MIAMQYSFVLPADYDMAIVRERIASKGALLDNLPGLVFKAYLHAERDDAAATTENLYAPFYLWQSVEAMHDFLNGPGFSGVSKAFGWPSVRTWTPWHASVTDNVKQARYAMRSTAVIAPYSALAELRSREERHARHALERGALAVVIGFEPVTWTIVRLCLWRDEPPAATQAGTLRYQVGHLSAPGHGEAHEGTNNSA